MYKQKTILALIPARGGSRGLPRKNLRALLDKPLIAWTIAAAKKSRYIDRVIVSTDDPRIARICVKYKADVPFLRPKPLANDRAPMLSVIKHALRKMRQEGNSYDLIMLLQPTSPLRKPEDIDRAVRVLFSKKARSIVSVCRETDHPYAAVRLSRRGRLASFLYPAALHKNRQELPLFYRVNGAIYLAYCGDIEKGGGLYTQKTYGYLMPVSRSVDIDDISDFEFACFLLSQRRKNKGHA